MFYNLNPTQCMNFIFFAQKITLLTAYQNIACSLKRPVHILYHFHVAPVSSYRCEIFPANAEE